MLYYLKLFGLAMFLLVVTSVTVGCTSKNFYDDAELYNRAAAMYCPESGVRTFMLGNRDVMFIVCKDGTRFTLNSGI